MYADSGLAGSVTFVTCFVRSVGSWGECSAVCGGGMSFRKVRRAAIPLLNAAYRAGLYNFASSFLAGCGVIFSMHRFAAPGQPTLHPGHVLHTDLLDQVLDSVRRLDWQTISMDEAYELISSGAYTRRSGSRSARFVCFTIDDGYADNLTLALPVFRKHNVPLCVFVTTGFVARSVFFWTAPNEELLFRCEEIDIPALGESAPVVLAAKTLEQKRIAYHRLDALCHQRGESFFPVVHEMYERHGIDLRATFDRLALTRSQLNQLASDPLVTIGCHTLSHPRLSRLSENNAYNEIAEARRMLEGWLGKEVRHLAYPFGRSDACGTREFAMAERAGFKTAVTTRPGNIFPGHKDHLHCLPRRTIPVNEFKLRNSLFGVETLLTGEPRFQTS